MTYLAFTDPAGGSGGDSMTLAIAHVELRDGRPIAVLDLLREVRPAFSPEQTVAAFAADLRRYRIDRIFGDRYAGDWPREQFAKHGIVYEPSGRTKSEIYGALLPALNSGLVELLDVPRLRVQLAGLERRSGRGGRDTIDHGPHGHDDVINAAAGAVVLALEAGGRRCWRCDDPDCGGIDNPPLMMLGSPASREWETLHQPSPAPIDDVTSAMSAERAALLPLVEALGRALDERDQAAAEAAAEAVERHIEIVTRADAAAGARVRALVERAIGAIEELYVAE